MKVIPKVGQSLIDIAIQEYGSAVGVIILLQENPGLDITSKITTESKLNVTGQPITARIRSVFQNSDIVTAAKRTGGDFNNDFNNDFN